jgi:hypothetical protein
MGYSGYEASAMGLRTFDIHTIMVSVPVGGLAALGSYAKL